jgi:superfamily II RNA helicase
MVKICSLEYLSDEYDSYFNKFSHPLHDFQKWSIESTINGHHVLACAPTGSGKSLCAEFAIDFFHSKGKKSIYCSPIKSLSNQKYYDFTQKYPHISIGLITGDIKINSTADVLIMTTEILLNKLSISNNSGSNINGNPSGITAQNRMDFEMNIENELGCIIFDEIHMIGDKDRGHVWENSIMLLPRHIQMICLSATLDNPEKFALWLETRGEPKSNTNNKIVYLTKKIVRPVPLTHYSFITVNSAIFKAIKDKGIHDEIKTFIDKPFILQDSNGAFNEQTYLNIMRMLRLFESKEVRVKRTHVLNQLSKHLVEQEMLPALCFVFSIKQLEKCAGEITTPLLEFDSKIPYTIERECEQIIRKLPNYREYIHLPEYVNLVALLQKGIAIHHSKMIPILREIVEILFSRGMIKMLFCTTSVAIGLNLPVKTSIFTDIYKHNGENITILQGHEYVQAAGRAGRLGLDTVGHVIHLNNLFTKTDIASYKKMMKGAPQSIVSNFKITYNLLLNLISQNEIDYCSVAKKSMIQDEIINQVNLLHKDTIQISSGLEKMSEVMQHIKTPIAVIEEYVDLKKKLPFNVNKKKKEIERGIQRIEDEYRSITGDVDIFKKYNEKVIEKDNLNQKIEATKDMLNSNVLIVLEILKNNDFIQLTHNLDPDSPSHSMLIKGHVATHFKEVHCLVFADLICSNRFRNFSPKEIVGILSCFTNIKISDNLKSIIPITEYKDVKKIITEIKDQYDFYYDIEVKNRINIGIDYSIHFDLIDYLIHWCECESEIECKIVLQKLGEEKDIFLGEFVKAILKINNIVSEMEKVAELMGDIELLKTLKEIPLCTMKFVATNQSLYV